MPVRKLTALRARTFLGPAGDTTRCVGAALAG